MRHISINLGRFFEIGNLPALPIKKNSLTNVVRVRFATLKKFAGFDSNLIDEVFRIGPVIDAKDVRNVLRRHFVKDCLNIQLGRWKFFSPNNTLKNFVGL